MITALVKRALYRSGVLGLYHRIRNRDTLTIVMFHRVLSTSDPRWRTCDPWYSMSDQLFAEHLEFFQRHYNVVSLPQVLAAHNGGQPLPARALLITFDDGWADNAEFALPQLQRRGMPALVFVVSDVIDRPEPFFQEALLIAWRSGRLTPQVAQQMWADTGAPAATRPTFESQADLTPVRLLIAQIEKLPLHARSELLRRHAPVLQDSVVHMLTHQQLLDLHRHQVAIGVHGKTHTPLVEALDLQAELTDSRQRLGEVLGVAPPVALSFPHGNYTPQIAAQARDSGYLLMFNSIEKLNQTGTGAHDILCRVGASGEYHTGSRGRLLPERLAMDYFRRPINPSI